MVVSEQSERAEIFALLRQKHIYIVLQCAIQEDEVQIVPPVSLVFCCVGDSFPFFFLASLLACQSDVETLVHLFIHGDYNFFLFCLLLVREGSLPPPPPRRYATAGWSPQSYHPTGLCTTVKLVEYLSLWKSSTTVFCFYHINNRFPQLTTSWNSFYWLSQPIQKHHPMGCHARHPRVVPLSVHKYF